MHKDLISVIMPCYNSEKYLEQCLDCLLNQTYKYIEVIIVNDGSTDNSKGIMEEYKEKFEKNKMNFVIIDQKNSGQAEAINKALNYIRGEYFVWQDSDDYYEDNALEVMHDFLTSNREFNFVRGKVAYRESKNLELIKILGSNNPLNSKIFDSYVFETDSYCFPGIFMTSTKYFDSCIENRTIYNSRAGQNWQLILPMAYNGRCGYLDKVVYNYRVDNNSHSHSVKKLKDLLKRCDEHKDILYNVINNINSMPEKEKNTYIRKVSKKYFRKKLHLIKITTKHKIRIILNNMKNINSKI